MVFGTPYGLFTSRLIYQSSALSLSVIANCMSFVSSSVIFFSSRIFSQKNKCFSVSSNASPRNSSNLIVGSCPAILNCIELLPPHSVDNCLLLPNLAPPVDAPLLDACHVVFLPLKFDCLSISVLSGILVTHGVVGSTLTAIWIGVFHSIPNLGPHVFLSYVV
jgi:hypothetical protein